MAKRGNRPKDAEHATSGVRGTHDLGGMPRERAKRGGAVAFRTSNWDRNASASHHADIEAGTGEEHEFQLANAMGELESIDERAARREHDAAEAQAELDAAPVLDAAKGYHAGGALEQHRETHGRGGEAGRKRGRKSHQSRKG